MRAPKILLTVAVLLFVGFLVSPGFVDSVKGDGTVTMLPGFASVVWHALLMPSAISHSPRETLVLIPLLLAHAAFVILLLMVALGRFRPRALRYTFCGVFVCGLLAMTCMAWSAERIALGVYLWLLAALVASSYCLLPRSYDT
jgi:hypothetical protein